MELEEAFEHGAGPVAGAAGHGGHPVFALRHSFRSLNQGLSCGCCCFCLMGLLGFCVRCGC